MQLGRITCLFLCVFVLGACQRQIRTRDTHIRDIQVDQLQKLMANKKKPAVLVDVRPASRYAKEHIPGSVNIPLNEIKLGDPRLAKAHSIIVYAAGPDDYLAPAGFKRMMAVGYENLYNFRGGLMEWENRGGQAEQGPIAE